MAAGRRERREMRVSFAALLRIRDDDRHVLLHSPSRPGSFNPPGGVYKYFRPAARILDALGYRADRAAPLAEDMRSDLRGFLPASSLGAFQRWFSTGAYREDATECLRRELAEELAESDLHHLVPDTFGARFEHVRTVVEDVSARPGRAYRQVRHLEVYEPILNGDAIARLCRSLVASGMDEGVPAVICASSDQIAHGRSGAALIGGHAAYLIGDRRFHADLPMVR
ncbi:hypothetical protein LUW76_32805 [Actinomadura madurae]|uniref:SMODS-associated NUDIX domain-containing protein n=1 Tax=Actinomadura madurae TaxID=1993 RepID=UPI0020265816|nr:hypothetical protein [Actinomadura madurae]URM98733.1 hypothetical protein LUW76_32805 [Actinomadura madurae]